MAIGGNFRTSSLEYLGRREASSGRGELFLGFGWAAQEEIAACQKVAEPAQAAVMAWGSVLGFRFSWVPVAVSHFADFHRRSRVLAV